MICGRLAPLYIFQKARVIPGLLMFLQEQQGRSQLRNIHIEQHFHISE
jgi:hypothetical protein